MTRTQLLHAQERWPQAITPFLWPYALRIANDEWNNAPNPRDKARLTPLQRFSGTKVQRNINHSAPFGCPTYVLTSELQARLPFHKWKSRANVGIYLGKSPLHARNVALVMDRNSGRVSPQYHVKFDVAFDTVQENKLECTWMLKAGFIRSLPPTSATDKPTSQSEQQSKPQDQQPLIAESSTVDSIDTSYDPLLQPKLTGHHDNEVLQHNDAPTDHPILALKAQSDPDTMYHHQAMREPDHQKFTTAMDKEIADQMANGNFLLVPRSSIPKGATVLNAV